MTLKLEMAAGPAGQLGIATRDVSVRVLNCSASGCLLETNAYLDPGAIASLRITVGADEFEDDVQVMRCQAVEGAGALFRVGVRFLWSGSPERRALRHVVWRWCQGESAYS